MIRYLICRRCSHTQDAPPEIGKARYWWARCYSCGCDRGFNVMLLVEQPDGSVVEVQA